MFDLVADIERYPEFVPGWRSVEVCGRSDTTMEVRQVVRVAGLRLAFESTATLERPRRIAIAAHAEVFDAFAMEWLFRSSSKGCRVTLRTHAALRAWVLQAVLVPALARQHREIVRCFEREAKRRYGSG